MKKKNEEKTKEEMNKINVLLQKKLQEKADKIKSVYEKKYKEAESKFEQMSQVMMSSMSNISLSNINKSSFNYEHKGIKCERCFIEPIIGYRYKCSVWIFRYLEFHKVTIHSEFVVYKNYIF